MGKPEIPAVNCTGCGSCVAACQQEALAMVQNACGFWTPQVDAQRCVECGRCQRVCPVSGGAEALLHDTRNTAYYAVWAKAPFMDPKATSGGILTVLAKEFLESGGLVCGAALSADCRKVAHILCETEEEAAALTGSKYVQSQSEPVFRQIREALQQGKRVLFVGTPCQVAGLKSFLGGERDGLYTADFLCHGAPAPRAWETYVQYLEKRYRAKLVSYNFRSKRKGWGVIDQDAEFEPPRKFRETAWRNAYHLWFGQHLSLPDSCFSCQFRRQERVSDITVGDFWHIEDYYPDLPTSQGVSCVLTNTEKGAALLEPLRAKDRIVCHSVSAQSVWEKRKVAQANFPKPAGRDEFMETLATLPPEALVKRYPAKTFLRQVRNKLRAMMK